MITPGAVRLFLALVVVVHHSTPLRFGSWAVYAFLILSGYWIARMWDEKYCHTRGPVLTFLVSRWWRLAPVLFSCLGLTLVCSWIWGWPLPELNTMWFVRQLLIVGSTFQGRIIPPQWSLDVEMQFYLVAAFLFSLLQRWERWPQARILGWAAVVLTLLVAFIYLAAGRPSEMPLLWPWLGFFLIGVGIWKAQWKPSPALTVAGLVVFSFVSLALILWPQTRSGLLISGRTGAVEHLANWPALWQAFGALLVVPFLALNVRVRSGVFDRLLGNWAYPLYLFHWLPRNWYYQNVDWARPWKYNLALLVANFAIALAGSSLILWLIDRRLDKLRAKWVKRRQLTADRAKVGAPEAGAASVC